MSAHSSQDQQEGSSHEGRLYESHRVDVCIIAQDQLWARMDSGELWPMTEQEGTSHKGKLYESHRADVWIVAQDDLWPKMDHCSGRILAHGKTMRDKFMGPIGLVYGISCPGRLVAHDGLFAHDKTRRTSHEEQLRVP